MQANNKTFITPTKSKPIFRVINTYSGYVIENGKYKQWEIKNKDLWIQGDTTAVSLTEAIMVLHSYISANYEDINDKAKFAVEMVNGVVKNGEVVYKNCYRISLRQAKKFKII